LLGAGFGLMRGALLVVAVTVVVSITPLKNSKDWQASQGVLVAKLILNGLKPILPPQFGSYLSS
jgi:membrane protein required for colicin V production